MLLNQVLLCPEPIALLVDTNEAPSSSSSVSFFLLLLQRLHLIVNCPTRLFHITDVLQEFCLGCSER